MNAERTMSCGKETSTVTDKPWLTRTLNCTQIWIASRCCIDWITSFQTFTKWATNSFLVSEDQSLSVSIFYTALIRVAFRRFCAFSGLASYVLQQNEITMYYFQETTS